MLIIRDSDGEGSARPDEGQPEHGSLPITRWLHRGGAAVSAVLVLGVVVWGYRLAVRDVSGLPVIQAMDGPARVAPEDPGGDLARHVGLSVNDVAATGTVAAPSERVVLAPAPEKLVADDVPMTGVTAIPETHKNDPLLPEEAAPATEPRANVPAGTAIAVSGEPAADGSAEAADTPAEDDSDKPAAKGGAKGEDGKDAGQTASSANPPVAEVSQPDQPFQVAIVLPDEIIPQSVPGVKSSPRPVPRPAFPAPSAVSSSTVPQARPAGKTDMSVEVSPADVAPGTRVVQIGAFDSPEIARGEWDRIAGKYASLMSGKKRVVQQAISGGRTFYRLRILGYKDLEDARRFCAALVAEGTDCIPTLMH